MPVGNLERARLFDTRQAGRSLVQGLAGLLDLDSDAREPTGDEVGQGGIDLALERIGGPGASGAGTAQRGECRSRDSDGRRGAEERTTAEGRCTWEGQSVVDEGRHPVLLGNRH